MGNNLNFTVDFDINLKKVQSGMSQLQQYLSKLKLPDSAAKSFDALFTKLQTSMTKYQTQIEQGFKTKSDITSLTKTQKEIEQIFSQIISSMESLESSDNFSKFFQMDDNTLTKIQTLRREIQLLQTQLTSAKQSTTKKLSESINNMLGDKTLAKSQKKNLTNVKQILDTEGIEAATAALEKYNAEYEKFYTNNSKYYSKTDNTFTSESVEKTAANYQNLVKIANEYQSNLTEIQEKTQEIEAIQSQFNQDSQSGFQTNIQNAKEFAQEQQEVVTGVKEAAEEQVSFNSQVSQLQNSVEYFFGLQNGINLFKRAIQSAIDTVEDLDAAMTEIAVVSDFSVSDMWERLPDFTEQANELGVSIESAYEATTLFVQQGLDLDTAMGVATETLKMARIADLDAADAKGCVTI